MFAKDVERHRIGKQHGSSAPSIDMSRQADTLLPKDDLFLKSVAGHADAANDATPLTIFVVELAYLIITKRILSESYFCVQMIARSR